MKGSVAAIVSVSAVLAAVAGSASAGCGDGWMGRNLVASPSVKAALQETFVARRGVDAALVPGRTYYGDYSGTKFAVAVFALRDGTRRVAVLRQVPGRRWELRRTTTGAVCSNVVPIDLIAVWWLKRAGARCYVEPTL
jgi:hypothetical protein